MLGFRQNFTIIGFFFVVSAVIIYSSVIDITLDNKFTNVGSKSASNNIESYFRNADYYLVGDERSNFHLFSDELIHNHSLNELILSRPNGVIFTEDGEPTYYSSHSGYYKINENTLFLKRSVLLRSKKAVITADALDYDDTKKVINASGNVFTQTQNYDKLYEVVVKSNRLKFYPNKELLKYSGKVEGKVDRNRKYEIPVSFGADRMSFHTLNRKATLDGNVYIKKQGITAQSRRGEIFLENYNKKLKYFALYDDVIVKERVSPVGQKPFERKAFSEKLEGYTSESKVVLLGNPKVYQKDDVLKGNIIVLRENNETIEVDDANTNFRLR